MDQRTGHPTGRWSKSVALTGNTLNALAWFLLIAVGTTYLVWGFLVIGPILQAIYYGD
jgi:hypothetical protein